MLVSERCKFVAGSVLPCDVDTSSLLHELGTGTQDHSPDGTSAALFTSLPADEVTPRNCIMALVLDRPDNLSIFGGDVRIVNALVFQIGDDNLGFIGSVMGNEPTRRLWQPGNSGVKDEDENELEGQGEAPGNRTGQEGKGKGDPVGEREAGDIQRELDDDQLSTPLGLGSLTLPDRGSGCVDAVTKTGDDAAHDHLRDAVRGDLEQGTDGHDCCSIDNRVLSTPFFSPDHGHDGSEETANVIDGRDGTEECCIVVEV